MEKLIIIKLIDSIVLKHSKYIVKNCLKLVMIDKCDNGCGCVCVFGYSKVPLKIIWSTFDTNHRTV